MFKKDDQKLDHITKKNKTYLNIITKIKTFFSLFIYLVIIVYSLEILLFSFTSDLQDFNVVLSEQEKEIIVRTLSAIGQIEVAVKKFWSKLGDNLPHPSFSDLGFVMANVEVIHNNAYERLLEVLGLEEVFEENLYFFENQ